MTKKTNIAAGAIGTAVLSITVMAVGVPLLVVMGQGGSAEPTNGGFNTDGIPPVVAAAYLRAADAAADFEPPCAIPPWILAGVGEIESGHGTHGGASADEHGDVSPRIVGLPLPQLGGDTDGGLWDGSTTVDHAVGPMQFIPSTWRSYALDGNGDGIADPHNIYDAALTAANYLCASGGPMATEADWRRGLFAYNRSHSYVDEVLQAAYRYRSDPLQLVAHVPDGPVQLVEVAGIGLTNASWAHQVRAMLTAAAADGLHLTGHSYRDPAQQIALRRANCGTSHYAVYEMPANRCSPPTARPGTSNHERGLAIDFDRCSTRATACHRWLAANAATYGLYNLASEPWHWSIDGR